ncbi:hypothetical protein FHR92_000617 [Fontibacillus solani]|uniref:DUF3221 domain-containing protein n=1 Tax=Fontibacillus solani TaxID=1572857 RepID=A0A7W3SQ51_9BACL|nr:DUF3221 domain-containing protein [Fontibacillus solani]MBA9084163.1 hypothetical protein [Fontibacillus solani]
MRRIILLLAVLFILSGCNSNMKIEGYVIQKDEGKILLFEGITKNQLKESLESDDPLELSYPAYSIRVGYSTYQEIEIGQKVVVEIKGGIDDAYPAQANAKNVRIIFE